MIPTWGQADLPRAVAEVAAAIGRPRREVPPVPPDVDERALDRWVGAAAGWLGLEAVAVVSPLAEVGAALAAVAPALVRVGDGFVVLCGAGALAPDGRVVPYRPDALEALVTEPVIRPLRAEAEALIARIGVPEAGRSAAVEALLRAQLGDRAVPVGWMVRLDVAAPPRELAQELGLAGLVVEVVGLHALGVALVLASWAIVGHATLGGRADPGLLVGWVAALLCVVPLRMRETALQGQLVVRVGATLKRRMLRAVLASDPSAIRHEGHGALLGRVHEAEQVETLGATAALVGAVSSVELLVAGGVLAQGAGGALHAALLGGWVLVVAVLARGLHLARRAWTEERLRLTHTLVEQMAGHRTRLVQEPADRWHEGDDTALAEGWRRAEAMDPRWGRLRAVAPRGWMVLAIAGLIPAVLGGSGPGSLAIGIGGVLLAASALDGLAAAVVAASGAAIAWGHLGPLAATPAEPLPRPHGPPPPDGPVIEARDLSFRHAGRPRPALAGCDLTLRVGDQVLLEGPSGSGKSTLGSILVGLRAPDSGLLLLRGLDRRTLGPTGWRRAAAAAPQFHENHVLTETFAFNLLMGRHWPPSADDLRLAAEVCGELGLDELVGRMPGGLWQLVGDTGWQLSHGEQSRLFLARALLQDAELVVLDETFAALDPPTLARALAAARRRSRTLVVVAHP